MSKSDESPQAGTNPNLPGEWKLGSPLRKFPSAHEARYRANLRQAMRLSRTGLFLIFALSFLSAPLYQAALFHPPRELWTLITLVACATGAIALGASAASFLRTSRVFTQALQSVAVLAIFAAILMMRYLALDTGMRYPAGMVGVVIFAVVFFGGFDWIRIAPVTLAAVLLGVALEVHYAQDLSDAATHIYQLSFIGVIGILGSYNQEVLTRWRWWSKERLRQAKTDLQESETRFQAFMENTPALTWIKDDEGRYVTRNKAFRDQLGDEDGSWIGHTANEVLPSDEARIASETDQQVLRSRKPHQYEVSSHNQAGEEVTFWVHKFPILESAGRVYIGAVGLDITERKRLMAELRDSETRFHLFLDNAQALSWIKDTEGRYLYVNEPARKFMGIDDDSWRGRTDFDFVPKNIAKTSRDLDLWVLEMGQPMESVESIPTQSGQEHQYKVLRFQFTDTANHRYLGGLATDITQLMQAQKAAQDAAQSKSSFLANMSHEIRTPMNAIIGMTSVLQKSRLTDEQQEWTEVIRNSGDHLLTIINDILDFSKIEAGIIELETRPFSLRENIESAMDVVAMNATQKGVEIEYFIHPGVPEHLLGDSARLRQILLNLLSNAIKFTPNGGRISIEVQARKHGDEYEIQFSVRDTGIGMNAEQLGRLFKPFSQADASTTRVYGGTGLGLSICKRLLELMGGHIWAESTPGEGSTFRFSAYMRAEKPDAPAALDGESQLLRGKRVLIIDDAEISQRILQHYFSGWGMEPRIAKSADEALALLQDSKPFDVLLIDDLHLQDKGLALPEEFKRLHPGSNLPIVLMRSSPTQQPDNEAISVSLLKPIKPSRLRQVMTRLLQDQDSARTSASEPDQHQALAQHHPLRILVAEDNVVNQQVVKLLLGRMGYKPVMVADGQQALDAIQRETYDVILMDVQMPVLDGLSATRELCKRYPPETRPRIVGVSANAMAEDRQQAERAGMDDYIAKPFTLQTLVDALKLCPRLPQPSQDEDTVA